eukprot:6172122-Pleurochrysis_carterae.AAC.2
MSIAGARDAQTHDCAQQSRSRSRTAHSRTHTHAAQAPAALSTRGRNALLVPASSTHVPEVSQLYPCS